MVVTQWGSEVVPFSEYSTGARKFFLEHVSRLIEEVKAALGIDLFLSYGGLLGAVREGGLISHDFDLDIIFLSPGPEESEIISTSRRLQSYLVKVGHHVTSESNGQIKVQVSLVS